MKKRKKTPEPTPVLRSCDCWLEIGSCYCETDDSEKSATRFSVLDLQGEVHSRWETLKEAMDDGRRRLSEGYNIFDNLEKRIIINYES